MKHSNLSKPDPEHVSYKCPTGPTLYEEKKLCLLSAGLLLRVTRIEIYESLHWNMEAVFSSQN